jgi:acetoin utilization deacetylase AcuC-like enzyme
MGTSIASSPALMGNNKWCCWLQAAQWVMKGDVPRSALAVVRPPGHHAECSARFLTCLTPVPGLLPAADHVAADKNMPDSASDWVSRSEHLLTLLAGCAMGFCFYNNVVLAALSLLEQGLKRILIFDWVNPDAVHGPNRC